MIVLVNISCIDVMTESDDQAAHLDVTHITDVGHAYITYHLFTAFNSVQISKLHSFTLSSKYRRPENKSMNIRYYVYVHLSNHIKNTMLMYVYL